MAVELVDAESRMVLRQQFGGPLPDVARGHCRHRPMGGEGVRNTPVFSACARKPSPSVKFSMNQPAPQHDRLGERAGAQPLI